MVWLGDRTRTINSAHVEYLSGIENPIGIKCGPDLDIGDLKLIIKKINPQNEKGKIVLICRLGVKKIKNQLPKIINMITKNQLNVIKFNIKSTQNNNNQSKAIRIYQNQQNHQD